MGGGNANKRFTKHQYTNNADDDVVVEIHEVHRHRIPYTPGIAQALAKLGKKAEAQEKSK